MSDRVRPLKMETSLRGTELDEFPTALDPSEDHVEARGMFLQNDTSDDEVVGVSRDASNNMTFDDTANSVTLTDLVAGTGGLTEGAHEVLDTLIHNLAEDNHEQITKSGGKISNVTSWTDDGETIKIREIALTRSSGRISQVDIIQYDGSGDEEYRMVGTVTRVSNKVDHIDWEKVYPS